MVDRIKSFEQLTVWQEAINLAVSVYKLTKGFPTSEQFALTNQLRRAVSSVSANIAEGFGRQGQKEKLQFYAIAYGSLLETKSFLYLAQKLDYLGKDALHEVLGSITILQKQLNALTQSIRSNG